MHPLIAQYLDLVQLQNVLHKTTGESAFENAILQVAQAHAGEAKTIVNAKASQPASAAVQAAQLFLTTEATIKVLTDDEACGPAMKRVEQAFLAEGAQPDEVTPLLGAAILEEAYGYADDPDVFDREFLLETFETLVPLASLTEEKVDGWVEAFSKSGDKRAVPLRLTVAQTLFTTAWSDGPALITAETVDDTVEALSNTLSAKDMDAAGDAMTELLDVLADRGLIGQTRLARLQTIAQMATDASTADHTDEEEDDDNDVFEDDDEAEREN
jgi:hypothetical protein